MKHINTVGAFLLGVNNNSRDILDRYSLIQTKTKNRINAVGDIVELYIKDLYCDSINRSTLMEKEIIHKECFSYISKHSSPPDCIINGGEAIEIKKQDSTSYGKIALNSSHPCDYLHRDYGLLTKECANCEDDWDKKPMVYSIVNICPKENKIKNVWFAYGNCFCASRNKYEIIQDSIRKGIMELEGLTFQKTSELGRVSDIDALNVSDLRIRGMWNLVHPEKIFGKHTTESNSNDGIKFNLVITKDDYDNLSVNQRTEVENLADLNIIKKLNVNATDPNDRENSISVVILHN